jgi:hypothetical protein
MLTVSLLSVYLVAFRRSHTVHIMHKANSVCRACL